MKFWSHFWLCAVITILVNLRLFKISLHNNKYFTVYYYKHKLTLWLLKDNVLQDINNKTIYKTLLTRKLTIAMHLQKISWGLCDVHNRNPKPTSFNNIHKIFKLKQQQKHSFPRSIFYEKDVTCPFVQLKSFLIITQP